MAKAPRGLSATFVRQVKQPGKYYDANGLYLLVDSSGASRWVLRIQTNKRRRDVGLGSASLVSLAEARELAHEIRKKARQGHDPVAVRRGEREGVPSFEAVARSVHAAYLDTWSNGKHTQQWLRTLEAHVFPDFGDRSVNKIEASDILRVLSRIWTTKAETARRVLQRISLIIDHATAAGHRSGENPCRIAVIGLPKQSREVIHFAALPYSEVPNFIIRLRSSTADPVVKLAFELLILTGTRSGEVRNALRSEFDLDTKLWIIPPERMKSRREHVVPMTPRAIEIVQQSISLSPQVALVFPSRDPTKPLSDMAFTMLLRRMTIDATAHGFRSAFRDWCSEETSFPSEVAEMALAHAVKNKVEAAYRRGKLLEKRKALMAAWETFCSGQG